MSPQTFTHVLDLCGALTRRGARVLSAQAHHINGGRVRIDAPPPGLVQTFAYREPPPRGRAVPVTCVAMIRGVMVEWTAQADGRQVRRHDINRRTTR